MAEPAAPSTLDLLATAGVPLAVSRFARDPDDAADAARTIGSTVVLKAAGLLHKSDEQAVIVGLRSPEAVRQAARQLVARLGERALPLLVQRQYEGLEVLVGLRREPGLGAVVIAGTGGIHTEVYADAAEAMVPLDRETAENLVRRLPSYQLLVGHRGSPAMDVSALVELLLTVSRLAQEHPEIGELDLNPVMVGELGSGAVAVDARLATVDVETPRHVRHLDLTPLLRPGNVAVVGVSDDPAKIGSRIYRYLNSHGYRGTVAAVHPAGGHIDGKPRYPSLRDLPHVPDLVSIAVPARAVPAVAGEAASLGVGAAIIHSSGFAETGEHGTKLQDTVTTTFARAGIPFAGPNCMGIVEPASGFAASLSGTLEADELCAGNIALLSSSGALGSCVASRLMEQGIGLSHWIHFGNEAMLDGSDYLEWLADDPATTAVGMLLENIADGERLITAGRRLAARGKPLFAFNMVRGKGAESVTLSHTGAMVGSRRLRDAVLDSALAVRVPTLQVFQDSLALASTSGLPAGNRFAGIAASGGACALIADGAESAGIALPPFPEPARKQMRRVLPDFVSTNNPMDVSAQIIAEPEVLGSVLETVIGERAFDAVLIQLTTNADPGAELTAKVIAEAREHSSTPVYVARFGANSLAPNALAIYADAGIAVLGAPDRTMDALACLVRAGNVVRAANAPAGQDKSGSTVWTSH